MGEDIIDGWDGDKDGGPLSNNLFYHLPKGSQGFNDGYSRSQMERNEDADRGGKGVKDGKNQ